MGGDVAPRGRGTGAASPNRDRVHRHTRGCPADFRRGGRRRAGPIANLGAGRAAGVVRANSEGPPRVMSALFDAARDLQTLLEMHGWGFCFIGGSRCCVGVNHDSRGTSTSRCCARLEAKTRCPLHYWTRDTWGGSRMLVSLPVEIECCFFNRPAVFRLISLWRRSRLRKPWWSGPACSNLRRNPPCEPARRKT